VYQLCDTIGRGLQETKPTVLSLRERDKPALQEASETLYDKTAGECQQNTPGEDHQQPIAASFVLALS